MLTIHLSSITQWLHLHSNLGGWAAFIISFTESLAIIGFIIPGSVTMTALGIMAGSGLLPIWPIIICAIVGAIAGDGLSYYAGYYFKTKIPRIWPFNKHPNILLKGRYFITTHGKKKHFYRTIHWSSFELLCHL